VKIILLLNGKIDLMKVSKIENIKFTNP